MRDATDFLNHIVDAWEALPGGRQVRNSDVERWLAADMAPAINAIRGFLRRPRPDGVLPPPPETNLVGVAELMKDGFLTCVAESGRPCVKVNFPTLKQAQALHEALAKANTEGQP